MSETPTKGLLDWMLELLFGQLAAAKTEQDLAAAGAGPDALRGAASIAVDLPSFGAADTPPPGLRESRDLAHLHPELRRRYLALKAAFQASTGRELFETCTYRSPARQQELYAQGRTAPGAIVTKLDGVLKRSRHNVWPAEAVDVCVDDDPGPGKHAVWDAAAYEPLRELAPAHGLIWGGAWAMHDYPHLELPAEAA